MGTTRHETSAPCCGRSLSASTGVGHVYAPRPGDLSVCAYCGEWLMREEKPDRWVVAKRADLTTEETAELQRAESIARRAAQAIGRGFGGVR